MIIAIPVMGILKVIFDRVPALNPLGYLLGNEDMSSSDESFIDKIKSKFKKNE